MAVGEPDEKLHVACKFPRIFLLYNLSQMGSFAGSGHGLLADGGVAV